MTNQDRSPEKPTRIGITEAELPPTVVEVRVADIVDHSEPITPLEPDFPTEAKAGGIALSKVGFERTVVPALTDEEKSAHAAEKAEKRAARKFSKFVNAHLAGEVDVDGFEISSFSLDTEGQLIPVDSVEFSAGNIRGSDDQRYPDDAGNVRILAINLSTANGNSLIIKHDRFNGFIEINPDSNTDYPITPERVLEVVDILAVAESQGSLNPVAIRQAQYA